MIETAVVLDVIAEWLEDELEQAEEAILDSGAESLISVTKGIFGETCEVLPLRGLRAIQDRIDVYIEWLRNEGYPDRD